MRCFLCQPQSRRLHLEGFEQTCRDLTDQLGLKCPAGHRARLHDFRHSFATSVLATYAEILQDRPNTLRANRATLKLCLASIAGKSGKCTADLSLDDLVDMM